MRHRLTHRARLRLHADAVCNKQGGLRLTEALHELYSGLIIPLVENIGVEGFACYGAVFQRAQIIGRYILLKHKSEHRGRAAEAGDFIFFKYRKNLGCVELIIVIDKNAALHEHLAVKLAPDRFAPAGISYRQMDAVCGDIVPILGGSQMRKGICMSVHRHLRVTGGAGREIDYHGFIIFRINSFEMRIGFFHVSHEVIPTVTLAVDYNSRLYRGTLRQSLIDLLGNVAVARADDRLYCSGVRSVDDIMLLQHECCGDNDRAELVQSENGEPELIVTLEDNHDHVALLDALFAQHICRLVAVIFQVAISEYSLFTRRVAPEKRTFVRFGSRDGIDNIISEIEIFRAFEGIINYMSVFVIYLIHKVFI